MPTIDPLVLLAAVKAINDLLVRVMRGETASKADSDLYIGLLDWMDHIED